MNEALTHSWLASAKVTIPAGRGGERENDSDLRACRFQGCMVSE